MQFEQLWEDQGRNFLKNVEGARKSSEREKCFEQRIGGAPSPQRVKNESLPIVCYKMFLLNLLAF